MMMTLLFQRLKAAAQATSLRNKKIDDLSKAVYQAKKVPVGQIDIRLTVRILVIC
jgi:hypothetical protein